MSIYDSLPSSLGGTDRRPSAAVINSLLPYPKGSELPNEEAINTGIRHKTLQLLQEKKPRKKQKAKEKKSKPCRLELKPEERKFALYKPLRELWIQYATRLLKEDPSMFADRVLRMDFHGAPVTVVRSRDAGLIGISGILIVETANTILIVTEKDRVVTVPKTVAVIEFEVGGKRVEVFLPALMLRASERSAKKMKKRHLPYL